MWVIVVLIPKGGGDYRVIGLLEPMWKVCESIMGERLNVIELHNALHGCWTQRGTGTATIDTKLANSWHTSSRRHFMASFGPVAGVRHDGQGPGDFGRVWGRAQHAAVDQKLLERRCVGLPCLSLRELRPALQVRSWHDPRRPTLLQALQYLGRCGGARVAKRVVRRRCYAEQLDEEHLRLFLAIFYDPELLQRAMDVLVGLFDRVGLHTNTKKTQVMICTPSKIRV